MPAGEHYGSTLQSWSTGRLTVSRIGYAPCSSSDLHGNESASITFVEEWLCVKQMAPQFVELPRTNDNLAPEPLQGTR